MTLERADFLTVVQHAPLVSIDFIVSDREGRILLGRRINEPAKDMWFTPGGRIQKNQTITEALCALFARELGLTLEPASAKFRGVYDHIYATNFAQQPGFGTHYVVLGFDVAMPDIVFAKLPQDQHSQWMVVSEAELLSRHDVHDNVKAFFQPTGT